MGIKIAAGTVAVWLTLAVTPLLFVPGVGGPQRAHACRDVAAVLATIRDIESGGEYSARASGSSASGAYQYIDTTWQHWARQVGIDTAAYPSAWMSTPAQQDAVAAANVAAILTEHDHDIAVIPLIWYYPAALTNPVLRHVIPRPDAGNTLTPAQYQARWLARYQRQVAGDNRTQDGPSDRRCAGTVSSDGNWALPAPAGILADAGITNPHHDYPAVDLMVPEGTPIYAITADTVTRTTHFAGNWWQAGCATATPPAGCATCGIGITIRTDQHDLRHTYCHNRTIHVNTGDTVTVGQHIANSGNTGRSGAPHLHLELRVHNTRRCPQPLLQALHQHAATTPHPAQLPAGGCTS